MGYRIKATAKTGRFKKVSYSGGRFYKNKENAEKKRTYYEETWNKYKKENPKKYREEFKTNEIPKFSIIKTP